MQYVDQSVWMTDGEWKGDCEGRGGPARTRKRCPFNDLLCAGSHHGFSLKTAKNDHVCIFLLFIIIFLQDTPSPIVVWHTRNTPSPLTHHVVCVPSLTTLISTSNPWWATWIPFVDHPCMIHSPLHVMLNKAVIIFFILSSSLSPLLPLIRPILTVFFLSYRVT